ncbi:hypothetical protein BMI89_17950 [Thioclava sp. F36-7]|nr:hypothetical protein BMI89_17950 [Thioclava sp. F36-7]
MFLNDKEVGARYGVTRLTIWRWARVDPTFPQPVKLSPQCSRWRIADLEEWEAAKATAASNTVDGAA